MQKLLSLIATLACVAGCDIDGMRQDGFTVIDGKHVWYSSSFAVGDSIVQLDVDGSTFEVFEREGYAKDKYKVFWRWEQVREADPSTFQPLPEKIGCFGQCYAHDANHIYLKGVKVLEADPKTFVILDAPYAVDAKQVYCGTVPMHGSDPASFEMLRDDTSWSMCPSIDYFVQSNGDEFKDFPTPIITSSGRWGRDKNFHYRDAAKVKDADYNTFRAIDGITGMDKDGEFIGVFRTPVWRKRMNADNAK